MARHYRQCKLGVARPPDLGKAEWRDISGRQCRDVYRFDSIRQFVHMRWL